MLTSPSELLKFTLKVWGCVNTYIYKEEGGGMGEGNLT